MNMKYTTNEKIAPYIIPLICMLLFIFLVFRNMGLEPFVFADEYYYSVFSRNMDLSESKLPSYLYLLLFRLTKIAGKDFLECARVLNSFIYILSFPFIYMVCRSVATRNVSIFITTISLLDPLNSYTAYFMPEATYFFTFWCFCWFVISYFNLERFLYGIISGSMLAVMSLIKPHAFFLLPGIMLFVSINFYLNKENVGVFSFLKTIFCIVFSFLFTKFSLSYALVGINGLTIFGSIYGSILGSSMDLNNFYVLIINSFNIFTFHLFVIVTVYSLSIAILIKNIYRCSYYNMESNQRYVEIFLISILIPLIIVTVFFTAHVTGKPNELLGRVHMRYYNFITPLLFIIAAGALKQPNEKNKKIIKDFLLSITLSIIILYTVILGVKDIIPCITDCPQWIAYSNNLNFLYLISFISIITLLIWPFYNKKSIMIYVYLIIPISVIFSSFHINKLLRQNILCSPYDEAGYFTRDYIINNKTSKVVVAGSNSAGLFRTMFHIDNKKSDQLILPSGQLLLPEGAPIDLSLIPYVTDWLVVVGDHPGFENKPRLDFSKYSIIQLSPWRIDFSENLSPLICIKGISFPETWGCFSISDTVEISFNTKLPKKFSLTLTAYAFGPNVGRDFTITVGKQISTFKLSSENQIISFDFDNYEDDNTIIIKIPEPISPKQLGFSGDDRLLGIGLVKLEINEIDDSGVKINS